MIPFLAGLTVGLVVGILAGGWLALRLGLGSEVDAAERAIWSEEVRYWRGWAGRPMRDWREASRN